MRKAPTERDMALLRLLQENAREPVSGLARTLGVSRTAVQERINRLMRDGVIEAVGTEADMPAERAEERFFLHTVIPAAKEELPIASPEDAHCFNDDMVHRLRILSRIHTDFCSLYCACVSFSIDFLKRSSR